MLFTNFWWTPKSGFFFYLLKKSGVNLNKFWCLLKFTVQAQLCHQVPKSLIFSQIHLQSCILAGGVAVGVSMSAVRHPWEAMIIGFAAAIISSIGFQYLKVFLTPS